MYRIGLLRTWILAPKMVGARREKNPMEHTICGVYQSIYFEYGVMQSQTQSDSVTGDSGGVGLRLAEVTGC